MKKGNPEDLLKIENLHEKDRNASLQGDFKTLRSLISDEAVIMPPGADFISGKKILDQNFAGMSKAYAEIEILEYDMHFQEVIVCGEYAFEYGAIQGRSQKEGQEEEISTYKVIRILRKEGGEWKVFRTMWNGLT